MLTLTAPWIVSQTYLHQKWTVDKWKVTGIVEQPVVVKSKDLQRLKMTESLKLDKVDQVPVKIEFS